MSIVSIREALSKFLSKGALPYWSILLLDCLVFIFSSVMAYLLNHEGGVAHVGLWYCLKTSIVYLCVYMVFFRLLHTYSGILRFSSFVDLQRIGLACFFGFSASVLIQYAFGLNRYLVELSLTDMVLTALIAGVLMVVIRVWVKLVYEALISIDSKRERVFIYGVLSGGVSLAKSLRQPDSPFMLAGFVSDANELDDKYLMGVPVFRNDDLLPESMLHFKAKSLLVSPLKNEALRENTDMVNALIEAGVKIYMMPSAKEWNGQDDITVRQLREVKIEDLLPRDEIQVDMQAIGQMLRGRRVMITGAAGSIGSEITRQIASFGPENMVLIDQAETPLHDIRLMMRREFTDVNASTIVCDICNQSYMRDIFRRFRPEFVFHAAAYKHVPMMEDNPMESIRNNVFGTKTVADLALASGVQKFVMVSTDKAVNPTNVMGCSKRICEIYVQSLDKAVAEHRVSGRTRFVTTRFGNVLGSNGSVIPLFKEQIKHGGPVTVTHPDIIRFFMLIPEACKLVLEAGCMGKGGEIYVFDMGKPVRIADLARRMIKLSGATDVEIQYTGLRDGEKLYEEVLNDEEITLPTFHPKIKIAKVREYDYDAVTRSIERLIAHVENYDDMLTVREMKALVPEFVSQHSKYEVLDEEMINA